MTGSIRTRSQRNKTHDLPPGVSVFVERGRHPGSQPCVTYGVNYIHDGRPDVRKFRTPVAAGEQDLEHARDTAIAFREAFVRSLSTGTTFDPSIFLNWRSERLYA